MKVQKVYFDGANHGRLVAITEDGKKLEQNYELCANCGCVALVMAPVGSAAPAVKKCSCSH